MCCLFEDIVGDKMVLIGFIVHVLDQVLFGLQFELRLTSWVMALCF